MKKTVFFIKGMDCPSEENLISMKLDGISDILKMEFDIPNRQLTVYHNGEEEFIEKSIVELNLGGEILSSENIEECEMSGHSNQRKVLWVVLIINFAFFIIEMGAGLISNSMGLVADSLDMLADSFVYGISLVAVGSSILFKKKIAKIAGYFQASLAVIGFIEVLRRFLGFEKLPDFSTMVVVSILALLANVLSLYILQRAKGKDEAHMKASMIFTSNDVIVNLGVIIAGILVNLLHSSKPDLIIGAIIFVIVMRGALRILKLSR